MNTNQEQRKPGLPCPRCGFFIEMAISSILYQSAFKCPMCALELTLDRTASRESLEALQQLDIALQNLESVKDKYR